MLALVERSSPLAMQLAASCRPASKPSMRVQDLGAFEQAGGPVSGSSPRCAVRCEMYILCTHATVYQLGQRKVYAV